MRSGAICYACFTAGRFLRRLPFSFIALASEAAGLWLWPKHSTRGISICDPFPEKRQEFQDFVERALELIQSNDRLRWGRVVREIRHIVNMPVLTGLEYSRAFKICRVDLRCFAGIEDRDSAARLLACRIIHEATHGSLCTSRVLQHRHFARVERLCYKEEARFARRLGIELGPDWGRVTDDSGPPTRHARRNFAQQERRRISKPGKD